ncbi:MAG: crossover junction endodeoxyribonuclease RuvC [Candidatus Portnoybacteria bacterium RBG_13_41_18]|uniref:Crossover junction endodeoxyribonuclease RuvC n=1 Tax=Candidatus Portnoybacteria bacterium RBG_13_41_18 TaxID=1801991 RepID=A0A1G2F5C1_9BACT|nr:MAG: crossover junction endodeoxyribonuclease RuvC [Candidatus Portnoybacteria bacterium RBG_13_41_18]
MIILGIDPGTARLGFGCISFEKNKTGLVDYGCVETTKDLSDEARLKILYDALIKLFKKYQPDFVAIERLFFFKNQKTVISVAQARGVALLAVATCKIPLIEITPLQIKQAVTGYGWAQKLQIQKMIKAILNLKEIPQPDDASDALATAICGATCINVRGFKKANPVRNSTISVAL